MVLEGKKFYDGALTIPVGKSGTFSIEQEIKKSGTKLSTVSLRTHIMGGHEEEDICYSYPTVWHTLKDKDGVWMTDLPIEQAQCDNMLYGNIYGTVLIGGLGLGYAAQLVASQPQVDKIIVVEKSQDVVNLVWKHLKFPNHVKVTIVVADLFEYLKRPFLDGLDGKDDVINCGFYDVWRSDGEYTFHEMIVPLRKLSTTVIDGPLYCWNEDIMRSQLLLSLHTTMVMLSNPFPGVSQLSLDELADHVPEKEYWHNWRVPYYKAIKNKVFELDNEDAMANYVRFYGRPDLANHMHHLLTRGVHHAD
jgi:hypothetical protein